jgi:hypothetical protein
MAAAVQPLHPAPTRTPERERLAAAIERRTAAGDHLARIRQAQPAARTRVSENEAAVEAAEAALRQAKADEPRRLAAQAIGEDAGSVDDVATATAAAATASEALDLARRVLRALAEREREAQEAINAAVDGVRKAARAVLNVALAPLAREFVAARERAAIIENIAAQLPPGSCPVDASRWPSADIGRDAARGWQTALDALEHDADARLPE